MWLNFSNQILEYFSELALTKVADAAFETERAQAAEGVAEVLACAAVEARVLVAVAVPEAARLALPTIAAGADKVGVAVLAEAVVLTRVRRALVAIWKCH